MRKGDQYMVHAPRGLMHARHLGIMRWIISLGICPHSSCNARPNCCNTGVCYTREIICCIMASMPSCRACINTQGPWTVYWSPFCLNSLYIIEFAYFYLNLGVPLNIVPSIVLIHTSVSAFKDNWDVIAPLSSDHSECDEFFLLFCLRFYVPVNSYGHVEKVSSPNHIFFLGKLD